MFHLSLSPLKNWRLRNSVNRLIDLLVLVNCCWFLTGCTSNEKKAEGSPPPNTSELVIALAREPDSLIPLLAKTEEARYVSELIFDGLVNKTRITDVGKAYYKEGLSTGYREQSHANRKEVTIRLKREILWHNNVPFSADDVLFTWDALHASRSSLVGWLDSFIEKIYKVNDDELHISLKIERSEEALNEIFSAFKILPRIYDPTLGEEGKLPVNLNDGSGIVKNFNYRPIGTGPYRIANRTGNQILFVHNEKLLAQPRIKNLRVQRIEAQELSVKSLLDGSLGLILDVPPNYYSKLDGGQVRPDDYFSYSFYAIAYNCRKAPFSSGTFRQAVNRATDKRQLFSAFTGLRESSTYLNTSLYPNNYEFVRQDRNAFAEATPYSVEAAKQQLQGISSSGQFTLLISSELQGSNVRALAQAYAEMMKQVGITVQIEDVNMISFDRAIDEKKFDAVFYHFSGFDHLYDFRDLFGDNDKFNVFGVRDEMLTQNLLSYGQTLTWIELERLSKHIHARVEELAPACFLFTPLRRAYMDSRLASVTIHPEVGFATIEDWDFR